METDDIRPTLSVDIIQPTLENGSYTLQRKRYLRPPWTRMVVGPRRSHVRRCHLRRTGFAQRPRAGDLRHTRHPLRSEPEGDIVWTYIGPIGSSGPFTQGEVIPEGNRAGSTANALIFKATHYTSAYLNATGQTISSGTYLEQWTDRCPSEVAWGWDRDGDGCVDDTDGDGVPDPFDRCLAGDDNLDLDGGQHPRRRAMTLLTGTMTESKRRRPLSRT